MLWPFLRVDLKSGLLVTPVNNELFPKKINTIFIIRTAVEGPISILQLIMAQSTLLQALCYSLWSLFPLLRRWHRSSGEDIRIRCGHPRLNLTLLRQVSCESCNLRIILLPLGYLAGTCQFGLFLLGNERVCSVY
jgi:hypothetical protein